MPNAVQTYTNTYLYTYPYTYPYNLPLHLPLQPTPTPTTYNLLPTTYSLQKCPYYGDKLRIEEGKIVSIAGKSMSFQYHPHSWIAQLKLFRTNRGPEDQPIGGAGLSFQGDWGKLTGAQGKVP